MRQKNTLGFGLLLLSGLFLWNPIIGVQDALPDMIGYLLLCLGLLRLSDLNDQLAETQGAFRAMIWVGFGRVLAWLLTDVLLGNPEQQLNRYERPVWVLIFAFVFLVLECYFLIPAWRGFFKGLSQLAEFHGGESIIKEYKGKNCCERLSDLTVVFVIFRAVMTLLPELTILTSFEKDAQNPLFGFDWYRYIELFRVLCGIAGLIFGAVWLIRYIRLMLLAKGDAVWQKHLWERYQTEVLPNTGLIMGRRIGAAVAFFRVGIFFTIDLSLSYHECLPDWMSVLLFLCGGLMLLPLFKVSLSDMLLGTGLAFVGILRTVLNISYLKEFIPQDALKLPAAYNAYSTIQWLGMIEALLMAVLTCRLLYRLMQMSGRQIQANRFSEDTAFASSVADRMQTAIRKKAIPVILFSGISCIFKIAEIWLKPSQPWLWIPQFFFSFVLVLLFNGFLGTMSEQLAQQHAEKRRV